METVDLGCSGHVQLQGLKMSRQKLIYALLIDSKHCGDNSTLESHRGI